MRPLIAGLASVAGGALSIAQDWELAALAFALSSVMWAQQVVAIYRAR